MAASVREATSGEAEALLGLYEGLFAPPGAPPPAWDPDQARARLAQAIDSPDAAVLVAEDGGARVGLCTAYLDLDSVRFGLRCWVEDLIVEEESRSAGAGGALLDAACDWARGRGASHLELDTALTRTDAQRFYERREPAWTSYCYAWEL